MATIDRGQQNAESADALKESIGVELIARHQAKANSSPREPRFHIGHQDTWNRKRQGNPTWERRREYIDTESREATASSPEVPDTADGRIDCLSSMAQ